MERLFRLTFNAVVAVLVLGGTVLGTAYWLAWRSLPDYDRTVRVAGLDGRTEIVRNTHNVPHIFGQSDADAYFGLGYAHAQDRLWQMTLLRRTAQGHLSELFGNRTLRTDELLRRLGLYRAATRSVAAQDPETLAMLRAYSAGVNARIRAINEAPGPPGSTKTGGHTRSSRVQGNRANPTPIMRDSGSLLFSGTRSVPCS